MLEDLEEQRKRIIEAMNYAVPEEERHAAEDVLEIYREDRLALLLLEEFYSGLPEAQEDWIREIKQVNRHRGIFLLAVCASQHRYLYLVSSEGLEFQGNMADAYLERDLLDFFGYESSAAFAAICADSDTLAMYEAVQMDAELCPACHAVAGEYHELGCPVEICPWCGGQLIHCDCRYEQLGMDAISSEAELLQFEALLEERGRTPYSPEQRPSFADDSLELAFE
jgi:hypothetical protein